MPAGKHLGFRVPMHFCIWVPCPSRETPAHWILLLLLINMGSLSQMVRFSLYPCLWVSEPLPLVEVLPELNHFDKYLIVALTIRYIR